jgi:phosphoribosylformylglycinamidine (FGAM) synthase PurS component
VSVAVAITLKIPDNEAYTAFTALRRLGVEVRRVERAEIRIFDEEPERIAERVRRNETLYNPNKHEFEVLLDARPRAGEVWIEELDAGRRASEGKRYVGWRLFSEGRTPVPESIVREAAEKLLCNPAIERAVYT